MSKVLTAQQILLNTVSLINQSADPSAGGGVSAAIGSLVLRSGIGQIWLKTGVGNTAWQKFVQSFNWYVVKDFGAVGDGVANDTAPIQATIAACQAAGGGVVFFPPGIYATTQISLVGTTNVQLLGSGTSSVIKWTFNAGAAAGSLLTVSGGATNTRISLLRFDGSGLTNPDPARENHLLLLGNGTALTTTHVMQCQFGGMVVNSGDGVHVIGGAGAPVSRFWLLDNNFDGCSRFAIGVRQGWEFGWIVDNYLTNSETEIAVVADAGGAATGNALLLHGNRLVHTGAVRHALRVEGFSAAVPFTRVALAQNIVLAGFVTLANAQWATVLGNIVTSGVYASANGVWRVFDGTTFTTMTGNVIVRNLGASNGPLLAIEKSTTAPSMLRASRNVLVNEQSGQFITVVDATRFSLGSNVCRSSDAGVATSFGIDVQAVTVVMTDVLVGPGNQMTTAANSLLACVRLLANGANFSDASVVGNQGDSCNFGLQREIGGGGGTFNGQILYAGNNFNSSVGDVSDVGAVVNTLHIGFNASTFGANLFQGNGSPEGVVTARTGSQYQRLDGGQATTLYYKESGAAATGWVAVGGSPVVFGADDLSTVATALFFAPGYVLIALVTEVKFAVTRPGTIRNLRVQVATAGTGAATVTYTVRKNGVDTALTCTLANTASGGASDLVHSFTVVAGDQISISIVKSAVVVTGQRAVVASFELT